ncbi:MAG TPA: hypothetical protein VKR79_12080 [Gaiellaceae bacterium]|nr:hypothetical protein [Gaiellaceae bacterium]
MGLFRKRNETYNERMLREAGLVLNPGPETFSPEPTLLAKVGLPDGSGVGPSDWDTSTVVTAAGLPGSRIEFAVLPDGDLIVDDEDGAGDLTPFADAIEERVTPPYRATAVRQDGDIWGVGAKRIDVARIPFAGADSLELSRKDSWDDFRVDGEPSDAKAPPELVLLGTQVGSDFFVKAERLDGDLWEVRVSAL